MAYYASIEAVESELSCHSHSPPPPWILAWSQFVLVQIIEENKDSAKAWFRKGEANFALNDWEAALKDFQNTVALDAANKAAKNKVRDIYFISFLFDE